MLSLMDAMVSLVVKVLWKFISLICFRVYLEVNVHKNPTCFSRWSVRYHYVSEEEFKQKIRDGFFAEWKSYDTAEGIWYYGTALEDLEKADDKSVIILTPEGFRDVKNRLGDGVYSIYIYANNSTIKKRLKARGDNKEEAERRFEKDCVDFKGIESEVDKIVYNNDGYNIDDVIRKILEIVG